MDPLPPPLPDPARDPTPLTTITPDMLAAPSGPTPASTSTRHVRPPAPLPPPDPRQHRRLRLGALDRRARLDAVHHRRRRPPPRKRAGRPRLAIPWSAFLHGDVAHLAGNCVILYILGMGLEHAVGVLQTAATYAFAALCGATLSLIMQPGPSVGASGRESSASPARWSSSSSASATSTTSATSGSAIVLLAWAAYQVVTGFLDPRIDNYAHVGGLAGALSPPSSSAALHANAGLRDPALVRIHRRDARGRREKARTEDGRPRPSSILRLRFVFIFSASSACSYGAPGHCAWNRSPTTRDAGDIGGAVHAA